MVALVPNLGSPFFAKILAGMGAELACAGYDLLVADTMQDGGRHRALARFLDASRADGIILLDGQVTADDLAALLSAPPVVMACEWIDEAGLPRVVPYYGLGIELAARHLLDLDYRRIGWIGGPAENVLHLARCEGLERVWGHLPPGYPGDFSVASGAQAARSWLGEQSIRPSAIVSFSDELAVGFVSEVSRAGVSIPRDVSIVGFDDIDWVAYLPVPLTTIHQPKRELGRRAADFVIQRSAGAEIPAETFCNRS